MDPTDWIGSVCGQPEKPRRFLFSNPQASGVGAWLEFAPLETRDGRKILPFDCERGKGWMQVSDKRGILRSPFEDRNWCFGILTVGSANFSFRLRFIDEQSSGKEAGLRIYTHWRHDVWNTPPDTDKEGRVLEPDAKLLFGWSPNGNGYYWEEKPVVEADASRKTPKAFVPKGGVPLVKPDAPSGKKPKIFIPKSKSSGESKP
ncbi:MAG: hypothetical protein KDC45_11425 [Bacteroidetes bacterium]|nr:hypothetical protein [Bacteroidota bacterium]